MPLVDDLGIKKTGLIDDLGIKGSSTGLIDDIGIKGESSSPDFEGFGGGSSGRTGASGKWNEGPIGISETLKRHDYEKMIPFNPKELIEVAQIALNPNSPESRTLIQEQEEIEHRGRTMPGQIAEGVLNMVPFALEFGMTGGAAAPLKEGAEVAATKVLGKYAKERAARAAIKTAGMAAGALGRTAAMPHRVASSVIDRMNPDYRIDGQDLTIQKEGEKPFTAIAKGFGDVLIENFSEVLGADMGTALSKGTRSAMRRVNRIPGMGKFVSSLQDTWIKLNPKGSTADFLKKLYTKGGYNGIIEEMGEERVGDILRATFGIQGDGNIIERLKQAVPTPEQLAIEAGVFSIPQAGASAVNLFANQRSKQRENRIQERLGINQEQQEKIGSEEDIIGNQIVKENKQYPQPDGEKILFGSEKDSEVLVQNEVKNIESFPVDKFEQETQKNAESVRESVLKEWQPALDTIAADLLNGIGGTYTGTAKSVKSIVNKVVRKKREGIPYTVYEAKDHARGKIELNDWKDAPEVIRRLKEKGFSIEITINDPLNDFGYRGINSTIKLSDKINGEIQIHTKDSWALKEKKSDKLYRKWRDISDKDMDRIRVNDIDTYQEWVQDKIASRKMWNDYWSKIPESIKSLISSSGKGLDSVAIPKVTPEAGTQSLVVESKTKGPLLRVQSMRPSESLDKPNLTSSSSNLTDISSTSTNSIRPEKPQVNRDNYRQNVDYPLQSEDNTREGVKDEKEEYTQKEPPQNVQNSPGENIIRWEGVRGGTRVSNAPFAVKFKRKGYLRFAKEIISSPEDVAFAFRELKNEAVERFYVVGLKNGTPVSVEPLHIGTVDAALAEPYDALQLLLTKKADSFFIVHNHPSGNIQASRQDLSVSRRFKNVLGSQGLRYRGHVIINDTKFGFIDEHMDFLKYDHTQKTDGFKVSKYVKYVEWYTEKESLKKISSPDDVFEIIKGINTDAQNNAALLLLNTNNQILGIEVLPGKDVTKENIAASAVGLRAKSIIITNLKLDKTTVEAMKDYLKDINLSLLDVIYQGSNPHDVVSLSMQGVMDTNASYGVREDSAEYKALEETNAADARKKAREARRDKKRKQDQQPDLRFDDEIEQAYQIVEAYESQRDLGDVVIDSGGVGPYKDGNLEEEYKEIPVRVRKKNGTQVDEIYSELKNEGYHFESAEEFRHALIESEQTREKRLSEYRAAKEKIKEFEEKGKHIKRMVNKLNRKGVLTKSQTKRIVRLNTGQRIHNIEEEYARLTDQLNELEVSTKKAEQLGRIKERERAEVLFKKKQEKLTQLRKDREEYQKLKKRILKIDTNKMSKQNAAPIKRVQMFIENKMSLNRQLRGLKRIKKFYELSLDIDVPLEVLDDIERLSKIKGKDITLSHLRLLTDIVEKYHTLERIDRTIRVADKIMSFYKGYNDSIKELKDEEVIRKEVIESSDQSTFFKRQVRRVKDIGELVKNIFGIGQDHWDLVIESIAGRGTTWDILYSQVKAGIRRKLRFKHILFDMMERNLNDLDLSKWRNERVRTGRFNLTRGERVSLYLHTLNDGNLNHLLGGFAFKENQYHLYKITPEEIEAIIHSLTKEEKMVARINHRISEKIYSELNKTYKARHGYDLPKVEFYFRIRIAKGAMPEGMQESDALETLKGRFVRIGLPQGNLQKRVNSSLPLVLEDVFDAMTDHINWAASYIGLEAPLSNASKLLYDRGWKATFIRRYGEKTWKSIEQGMRDVAGEYKTYTDVEDAIMKVKNTATKVIFSLNIPMFVKQVLSFPYYNVYIKAQYIIQGGSEYFQNRDEIMRRHRMYSPDFRERVDYGYERELSDISRSKATLKLAGNKGDYSDLMMMGARVMDRETVALGMHCAVLQKLDELKDSDMSPRQKLKEAYNFADDATNITQISSALEHRSEISRGNPLQRLFTFASGATNAQLNVIRRTWRQYKRTKSKDDLDAYIKSMFYSLVIVPIGVIIIDFIFDWIYRRKEPEGMSVKSFVGGWLKSVSGMSYFIRDVVASFVSKNERGVWGGYDIDNLVIGAMNSVVDAMVTGYQAVRDKDPKKMKKFAEDVLEGALFINKIPYRRIKQFIVAPFRFKNEKSKRPTRDDRNKDREKRRQEIEKRREDIQKNRQRQREERRRMRRAA
jgi:DNA repair protein RadC